MSNDKVEATFHGLNDARTRSYIRQLEKTIARVRAVIANDWAWSDEADCRIVEVPDLERALDGEA